MAVAQQKITRIDTGSPEHVPMRVLEIELGETLPPISAFDDKKESRYQRARCLVRLHTQPLGLIDLQIEREELIPDEYAPKIWQALHGQINEHLRGDGFPPVTELTASGLPSCQVPSCIEEREQFLTDAPFVSVIVPTHNRPEQLAMCLSSLMALRYPHYEVIVVDNAPSTDATNVLVRKFSQNASYIRYVREDLPGPSWARNHGIRVARGKILAFVDDDVVVDPYWLVGLVRGFGVAENVACVTGLVLALELETPAEILFEEYGGFNKGFTRRIFDRSGSNLKIPFYPLAPGRFGVGASMGFTAAFLESVGGFDPTLGAGRGVQSEDIAIFSQVVLQGYKLVYEPASLLYHLHRRDYDKLRKQIYHYGAGFTSYLVKIILDYPLLLFELIVRLPHDLLFILNSRTTPRYRGRSRDYPKDLIVLERKGMFYGPFAYVRNRWEARKLAAASARAEADVVMSDKRES